MKFLTDYRTWIGVSAILGVILIFKSIKKYRFNAMEYRWIGGAQNKCVQILGSKAEGYGGVDVSVANDTLCTDKTVK